ncbi:MAG TPA: hypothetical protein VMC07_01910, partial [Candidatus Omnitrophota bacterium]|nr:hypothetical protein [Candidatus Omnitrophota bacterium]
DLWLNPPRILSEQDYLNKRQESLLIFAGVLSLLLFSVASFMKNLRDLLEIKKVKVTNYDN